VSEPSAGSAYENAAQGVMELQAIPQGG